MFQLPVNNLTRLRKARKKVKRLLSDIGLDYCKEHIEDYKEFGSDESYSKHYYLDVCLWDPSWTKSQDYRTKQFCCSDCPFASKYFSAYKNHFRNVHRDDFENRILLNCSYCMYSGNKRTLETHVRLFHMPQNMARQGVASPQGSLVGVRDGIRIDKPMLTDKRELPVYYCKKCTYRDRLYNVVRRHIYREHFQHVATPYVAKNSEKQENSEATTVNSHGIHCKSCLFVPRSYEALVQHVIEFHERIGHQVTAMIGHTNVIVARPQANIIQRGATITPGVPPHMAQPVNRFNVPKVMGMPVGNHFKQGVAGNSVSSQPVRITLPDKALMSGTVSQPHAGKHLGGFGVTASHGNASFSPSMKSLPLSSVHAATATLTSLQAKKASANALNTSQTQKWKICTICNELFPESAYSAHFEKEHQAEKVRAMAKYIMKIHNFTSKCLYCNRYLPSDSLLNHMLVHGLTCPQCHNTFYEVEKIVAHKRQAHPNEQGDSPTGSPLTFDLTLQQGSPKNVQLIITTYNMKEAPESSSTPGQSPNNAVARPTMMVKGPEKHSESLMRNASQNAVSQKKEVGKTLCPLCFTILKGPISDALAHHLRDRHQVLQTLHPVEKKLTYKCIHCLGVYTSNMTASTITLHLVHCRGVGQSPKGHCSKSISTLRSTGAGTLKRELVASDAIDPKRRKMVDQSRYYPTVFVEKPEEPVVLALDPKGHADESYEARKAFLTAYFNNRPYPSQREVEKLAASLWLWKSDVSSHFANRRRSCERDFVTRKPVVLLGFNMRAVNQLKHKMNFDTEWLFTVNNEEKSGKSRTSKVRLKAPVGFSAEEGSKALQFRGIRQALNTGRSSQSNCAFKPTPGTSSEPIAIDSDSESEQEEKAVDNMNLKTQQATSFRPSVVQTQTKGTVLRESFLYERDGRASRNSARGEEKILDGSASSSSPEEVIWTGSVSPNQSHYRPAGRFEEKGKEVGLLGR
ncbi:activity-dependent neuroprotector homeobox a [Pygocentrus nattereri]|uniref:C2H2-type domain-containing protein n=1 Tax=Pygocentrus nattereri TaxID=42514 RepID=A0A3B4BUC2_PYGNA|nr:activity-dependent neuroprotector homeobox a [Pygocentrus nattereri]